MVIKKINYLTATFISGVLLFSCDSNSNTQEKASVKDEEVTNTETIAGPSCYTMDNGKDKIEMNIVKNANMVTGDLTYAYFEKDKNSGTIKGEMAGDTLLAIYSFMSEGRESARQVAFLKNGDEFMEGYGNMNPATGEPDLTDRSSIKFENTFILKKSDCK